MLTIEHKLGSHTNYNLPMAMLLYTQIPQITMINPNSLIGSNISQQAASDTIQTTTVRAESIITRCVAVVDYKIGSLSVFFYLYMLGHLTGNYLQVSLLI